MRPPKAINDVGSCRKVAMMPSCVMGSSSKDCRLFVWFNDDLVIPLWISPPKAAVLQEEVQHIVDKHSISFLGEGSWSVQGSKPIMDVSQMLVCFARFVGSGEGVVGQWSGRAGYLRLPSSSTASDMKVAHKLGCKTGCQSRLRKCIKLYTRLTQLLKSGSSAGSGLSSVGC